MTLMQCPWNLIFPSTVFTNLGELLELIHTVCDCIRVVSQKPIKTRYHVTGSRWFQLVKNNMACLSERLYQGFDTADMFGDHSS